LLARDTLGIKPLYLARFAKSGTRVGRLAFASELSALLASGLLGTPHLDPQAVACGVWNGFVVGTGGTEVKGVETALAGHLSAFDGAAGMWSGRILAHPRPSPGSNPPPQGEDDWT